jgi:hypothetical protein
VLQSAVLVVDPCDNAIVVILCWFQFFNHVVVTDLAVRLPDYSGAIQLGFWHGERVSHQIPPGTKKPAVRADFGDGVSG